MAVPFRAATFCLYLAGPTGFDWAGRSALSIACGYPSQVAFTQYRDVGNPYIGRMHDIITVGPDDYASLCLVRSWLVGILYDSSKQRTRIDGVDH